MASCKLVLVEVEAVCKAMASCRGVEVVEESLAG